VDGLLSEAEVDLREESQREVALHLFSTDDGTSLRHLFLSIGCSECDPP
jgi:hypothetical protein